MSKKLRICLPSGSLEQKTLELFQLANLDVIRSNNRTYTAIVKDPRIGSITFLPAQEIAGYIFDGIFDCGITGADWIMETILRQINVIRECDISLLEDEIEKCFNDLSEGDEKRPFIEDLMEIFNELGPRFKVLVENKSEWENHGIIDQLFPLPYARTRFDSCTQIVVATNSETPLDDLLFEFGTKKRHFRVATEFVNLTSYFFKYLCPKRPKQPCICPGPPKDQPENFPYIEAISSYGKTEIKLALGIADAIVDITETGRTLIEQGATIQKTIMKSIPWWITNVKPEDPKRQAVEEIGILLKSALDAHEKRLLKFNIASALLDQVVQTLPSAKSPTINPLADTRFYSVETVAPRSSLPELISKIQTIGATDILVLPLQNIVRR